MKLNKLIGLGLVLVGLASTVDAAPVDVSFTTTGSSGNYLLDFSVTNNLDVNSGVYFFGVQLSNRDIVNSPSGFSPDSWVNWGYNNYYGGSSINYNNVWIGGSNIASGSTLSGFSVHVSDLIAPSEVNWFAFAYGGNWTGGGNINNSWNPGFEGVAGTATSVPEPSAVLLFGLGLFGLVLSRRRSK